MGVVQCQWKFSFNHPIQYHKRHWYGRITIMKTLLLNPTAGIAGDMLAAALLDAGADTPEFHEQLARIDMPCESWQASVEETVRHGIRAKHFQVTVNGDTVTPDTDHHHDHHHQSGRHLGDILDIINAAPIAESVKVRACGVFNRLAAAEGTVHNCAPAKVHFHEVGAVDAIVDIVAVSLAMEFLSIEQVICAPVAVGSGTVECSHGVMPVPAPAVAELLRNVPTVFGTAPCELTTPTGAALLTELCRDFSGRHAGRIISTGYGAGTRELEMQANVLQAIVCKGDDLGKADIAVVECNIDDMPGEWFSHVGPSLFDAGALDVAMIPCTMKKGRPGTILQVMTTNERRPALIDLLLRETTTFGVRWHTAQRHVLERKIIKVDTTFGVVSVKLGFSPDSGALVRVAPEYESCCLAARENDSPLAVVYEAAAAAARRSADSQHMDST
jgi:uncharacterized protein (TIGR00299 family) protein